MISTSSKPTGEFLVRQTGGEPEVLHKILPSVYDELRRLARRHFRGQRAHQTLQPTALVHEMYLRLAEEGSSLQLHIENRAHFLGVAAQLMQWIMVDYERKRRAAKRGGAVTRITLDPQAMPTRARDLEVLALDQALGRLAQLNRQQSRVVQLRFFGGLTLEETAHVLGTSPATVKRHWATARVWLYREMNRGRRA